jgi:hypothetical protein
MCVAACKLCFQLKCRYSNPRSRIIDINYLAGKISDFDFSIGPLLNVYCLDLEFFKGKIFQKKLKIYSIEKSAVDYNCSVLSRFRKIFEMQIFETIINKN